MLKFVVTTLIIYSLALTFGFLSLLVTTLRWLFSGASLNFWKLNSRTQKPAALQNEELGTHKFVQLNDVKLHYVEKGDHQNPLMLCLHGYPEFWYSWRHQLREFGNDFCVTAVDMRGYGESDKPVGRKNYHIDKLVGDIHQLMQALHRESCVLVAHDWGGAVAWEFARTYPQMVDKLIVLNIPHPQAFMNAVQSTLKQFFMSWYIFFFQLPCVPELIIRSNDFSLVKQMWKENIRAEFYSDEDCEAYLYTCSQPGALTPPINYYRAIDFATPPQQGPRISMPTLMIWGDQDMALSTPMAEASGEFVSDFTLKLIPGASHFVNQDQPQIVNQHMRDFLKI